MNQKVVHCLAQCLLLALGLYKCHTMGLLPTHDSDWLAFKKQPIVSLAGSQSFSDAGTLLSRHSHEQYNG